MSEWKIGMSKFEADEINPALAVSPWEGHRQFAYDLLAWMKPERVVELGTHYGCSFFSFLQACKDMDIDSEIVAIDCWEGDEQAGFYGEEVWDTVNKTLKTYFSKQNHRSIRKYFQDAIDDIENESADIIHIDGLHTYEAVSADFVQWLPKLKENGIVLFHDVASSLGYGTNTFWNEICDKYNYHYTFTHSWGLGVLFPKGNKYYKMFENMNMKDKVSIYEYSARYRLEHQQLEDHIKMVEERDEALAATEQLVRERDKALAATEQLVRERDKALSATEQLVRERDKALAATEQLVRERDKALAATEQLVRERDKALAATEQLVREQERELKQKERYIEQMFSRNIIERIYNKRENS